MEKITTISLFLALSFVGIMANAFPQTVNGRNVICQSEIGTIKISKSGSVQLDIVALPPNQTQPVKTEFKAKIDQANSTNGIFCTYSKSKHRGYGPFCTDSLMYVGMDHGSQISIIIEREISPDGQVMGEYEARIDAQQVRGDLGDSVSGAALYDKNFACKVQL